ncbi:MAG: DEAD/DEAH box helicase [Candidatus Heimdallarchaeaceae archaeon]
MKIDDLPLPKKVKDRLKEEGIATLYPPQIEAIEKGLFENQNLVVAIPTASGKTLIALLASIKKANDDGQKTLYLSPLRALAYEKYLEFKSFLELIGKRTIVLTGDYDTEDRNAKFADVIIATNEKIDSAIRHQAPWLSQIGLIISDEVHLINDSSRGPTLEVVLAQLRKITQAQLLALSATIKNADEIARWLEAQLVSSDWRPVKLKEGVVYGNTILYANKKEVKIPLKYKNTLTNLLLHILKEKNQTLVFGTTRNMAESTARNLASKVQKVLTPEEYQQLQKAAAEILSGGEKTKQAKELSELVQKGVSYHHAGLSSHQRRIIEKNFKKGYIKILSSTPTLAAGINLPARYVVIKSIYRYDVTMGSYPIPVLEFKQQAGRAGRPQYDKEGDALVIAKNEYEASDLLERYILAETEDIESRIAVEPALRRIILGQIASENTETLEELIEFFGQTFYGFKQNPVTLSTKVEKVIEFLREEGLIKNIPDYLLPTAFGKRVSQLYIDPLSGIKIREGLDRAKTMAPSLVTDMSLLHLVCSTPDVRFSIIRKNDQIPVINYISNHEDEFLLPLPSSSFDLELFMSQVKTALILKDWISETPEDKILDKYNIGSGDIYSLVASSEWLLYATSEIATLLGFKDLAGKVTNIHKRIRSGIKEELIDLVQIPGIGRVRARLLFDNGYVTRKLLKQAHPEEILKIPGFGKELVKNIFTNLLDEESFKKYSNLFNGEAEVEERVGEGDIQMQLDDFFS